MRRSYSTPALNGTKVIGDQPSEKLRESRVLREEPGFSSRKKVKLLVTDEFA